MKSLCNDWEYIRHWEDAFAVGEGAGEKVRLPHTSGEVPQHYAAPEHYASVCGYRRRISVKKKHKGKRVFLQFDGAGHIATVYLNGEELYTHRCGYTAFRVEITDKVHFGGEDLLTVRLDATENPSVPPFGYVIDYLTYGGLYREAWLDVRGQTYIEDLFVRTPLLTRAVVEFTVSGADAAGYRVTLLDNQGNVCCVRERQEPTVYVNYPEARPWTVEDPVLYTCRAELLSESGEVLDEKSVRFGFRTAEFFADGFYLNDERVFLRGLNRHQCYPYVGYAAPASLQREDARILKEELCCNAVRTSHYPQSQAFIDACDELGLLVFTEIPGWQHIGDGAWKDQAVENVREMVTQYRNHPSVILWGVRINESQDDDELYRRTNALAHALDPGRATSGVRYLQQSHLLEDVYAFNDFSHDGVTPPVLPKEKVTPDTDKALLISECNGHMFPTKPFDHADRRQEHALRHARVQSAAAADGEHAGCFAWCMFDYPTHKDFGAGDRVCYHGVLDAFRNPKLAAAVYASQGEARPYLEIGSSMDVGDYPAGRRGPVWAFTNADEIRLYKNGEFVAAFTPPRGGLPHEPVYINDTIGELLEKHEGMPPEQAAVLRKALRSVEQHGMEHLPVEDKARLGWCMVRYGMSLGDGTKLYGKYVGDWGGSVPVWRFDALKDGKVTASAERGGDPKELSLEVRTSHTALHEGNTYDAAAVRIRVLDAHGMTAAYAQLPLRLELEGDAALIGPDLVTAEGGMTGTYVRTVGRPGRARLTVSAPGLESVSVDFTVE
ncbi:MAG: glycoside hydrolase family 2 protein [Oscillospiraceae bacterium]|nr:glycoside hydrolase family 2 protein [Oscillospiraceae bacterium]